MTKETKYTIINSLFAVCGLTIGGIGLGYAISARNSLESAAKAINCSVTDISNGRVDIPKSLIESAVQKAADRELELSTFTIVDEAARTLSREMTTKARTIINESYGDIRKTVDNAIDAAIREFDIDDYKDDIVEACRKEATKKLTDDLKSIASGYKSGLDAGNAILVAKAAQNNVGTIRIIAG